MGQILKTVLAFFALLAAPLARAAEPVAAVPYRIDYGGWFTVSAMVNGRGPYDFIVDTGATQSFVFENLNRSLSFPPTGGPPQTVLGLAAAGQFPTYRVDEIAVGPARLENLTTFILSDWKVGGRYPQGVLGLDFLARYFVVFDRAQNEMRLYDDREALEIGSRGWVSTEFTRRAFNLKRGALYTVQGYPNSRRVRFIVDLGATGTIINKQALSRVARGSVAITTRPGSDRTGTRIMDALQTSTRQEALIIGRFRIGRVNWYKEIFVAYDAPIFTELGVQGEPFGLLGADLFHDRSLAMDFKGETMHIGPARN